MELYLTNTGSAPSARETHSIKSRITRDCIPVTPLLPVSSLSAKTAMSVSLESQSNSAVISGYAHTLSSCPYAEIKARSSPTSRGLPAGTKHSSLVWKSTSVMPYLSCRSLRAAHLAPSSSSPQGIPVIMALRFSPLIAEPMGFVFCSCER